MSDMDRRDFVVAALGGISLLSASGLARAASALTPATAEAAVPIFTRRNIYCLTAASREIVSYKSAITNMKGRPASDPLSWDAQANIHGATAAPAGMIANACRHDLAFFLSWHRMYLYYFERIVRQLSGDPEWALPYWGYSPTGRRDLPPLFRSPATAANPLYTSNRNTSINGGGLMPASAVDAGAALAQAAFFNFSSSVQGTPHNVVHGAVGGGMGSFAGAGRDPIFWLHHCNIDRLWELWLASGGGRVNPTTDTSWMTTTFNFYNETGATVSMSGQQIVDTACNLRYHYESDICNRIIVVVPGWWRRYSRIPIELPIMREMETMARRAPLANPVSVAQSPTVTLAGAPVDVTVQVSAEGRRTLERLPGDARAGGRLSLVLQDIRIQGAPRVYYEIYVNLPAQSRDTVYTGPHFAGNLGLFGPTPGGPHVEKQHDQIVPLSIPFARLRAARLWSNDTLRITFVPRGATEGEDPRRVLGNATQATIGRILVQIQ